MAGLTPLAGSSTRCDCLHGCNIEEMWCTIYAIVNIDVVLELSILFLASHHASQTMQRIPLPRSTSQLQAPKILMPCCLIFISRDVDALLLRFQCQAAHHTSDFAHRSSEH